MDPIILRREIQQLKARLELCKIASAGLEEKCSGERLSHEEKDEIAKRWGAALISGNELRAHLDRLKEE